MPGPVAHIVYAQKIHLLLNPQPNKAEFMLGTLFPDIRALKVINREKTHFLGVTYDQIQKESNPFKCGFLLHSLIDEIREDYVQRRGVYQGLPAGYLTTVALKICEDIVLYDKISDWQEYIAYLSSVVQEEKQFDIPVDAIQTWHGLHRAFFANPPDKNISVFLQGIGFTGSEVEEIITLIATISDRKIVAAYLSDFYDELESLLRD